MNDLIKYRRWYATWIPYLLEMISFQNFRNITGLELGAGIGAISSLLEDLQMHMTLSDVSRDMICTGRQLFKHEQYIYLDIQKKLTIKSNFDLIIAIEVLEHLDKPDFSIKNIKSLLKPNGWFIGTTPYPYQKNMSDPTHVNVQKPEYWHKKFKHLGFNTVKVKPLTSFPYLWKINPQLNILLPFNNPLPFCISTTVIAAKV